MMKKEAVEIAKKEVIKKGLNKELTLIFAFNTKKQTLGYSENVWEIQFNSQRLYTGTCVGQIMSYTEITVLIEDAFGNVIDSKIKVRKYLVKELAGSSFFIQISGLLELVLECLLSVTLFPFRIFYGVIIGFPISLINKWLAPPELKTYCPHCGSKLRTIKAKQCSHCFFAWHNIKDIDT